MQLIQISTIFMKLPNISSLIFSIRNLNYTGQLQTYFAAYKKSIICFSRTGSGPSVIVCLHGFGENRKSFDVLENILCQTHTLLSIDLPFHGDTEWNEGLLLTQEDLLEIIGLGFEKSGFDRHIAFSLLAYSLGGRIAMSLLQMIPERIERLVLLAPDGLRVNFWYWLGTQTWLGNKLFFSTMQQPAWFFAMANFAHSAGLLNKSIVKFIHYYLDDKEARLLLYKRWTALRKFKPDLHAVKKNIANLKIPVRFVFGSFDRIILDKRSNFFKTDRANVKVLVLQAGHQLLREKHVKDIAQQFSE
jgi:pimeloyl-ACP methyl ester carboxylesterase